MTQSRPSLLTALIATTIAVTAVLSWAGWRLLVQQRAIDRQRATDQLHTLAAEMTARLRGRFAEVGEHLSASLADPEASPARIDLAAVLTVSPDAVLVTGEDGLPFVPVIPVLPPVADRFTDAEALEFGRSDLRGAAAQYERLARVSDARIRAEALLRLGRVLRNSGDLPAALKSYEQLTALGAVRAGELPAELAGLYGERATRRAMRDDEGAQRVATQMVKGLDEGRWLLTRGYAELYRDELGVTSRSSSWLLADALERVWAEHSGEFPPRGQRLFGSDETRVLVIWRSTAARTAFMAARVDDFLPWPRSGDVRWQLSDPEGRWIAGDPAVADDAITRIAGVSEYPWTLHVAGVPFDTTRNSQTTQVAMMAAVLLFLWSATYFMARAIRREAAVARLQSDFVAAVSHEFRSPLTAIRQMTEMLEMGRVPGEDRRQMYYRVLAREAGRLQRLVETLLNFGRMEAGAARYQFAPVDAASFVLGVVRDVEPVAREAGKRIETAGPDDTIAVRADEHALGVALRNLIDNAIKYSPNEAVVRVEWQTDNGRAAIRVVDRGIGIPRAEHDAIFRKFVRGRSAIDGHVKGTGVGLSMVQQIVAAHGGEIRLESEVGRGSTFTMLLPTADNSPRPTPNSQGIGAAS